MSRKPGGRRLFRKYVVVLLVLVAILAALRTDRVVRTIADGREVFAL